MYLAREKSDFLSIIHLSIASQVQPIKGYEQFEATTGSDGVFRFKKLFPTSEYVLMPYPTDWSKAPAMQLVYETNKLKALFNKEGWVTEDRLKIQTGPEGQTLMLSSSVIVQPAVTTVFGKVADSRNKPLAGVKIAAVSTKPLKGYEQFETAVAEDGSYRFDKLLPEATYALSLALEGWAISEGQTAVECGDAGQETERSFHIRYLRSGEGVVRDTRTGLEWVAGSDRDTTWNAANTWVSGLSLAGGGWRMPTRSELQSLYRKGEGSRNMTSLLKTSGWWVWSGEKRDSSSAAWTFHFSSGHEYWYDLACSSDGGRAFAVRSRK